MNNNSVILITSHLNSDEKINVITKHIKELKKNVKLPIIHATNYYVDHEIQNMFDYTIIKKNEKSVRYCIAWDFVNINNNHYKLIKKANDHGFSHIDLMLFGFRFCKSLGFNYVYHLNYDVELSDESLNKFLSNGNDQKNKFYKYNLINNDVRITNNLFSINTDEFINAVTPKLELYRNGIDDGLFFLKKGWLSEEYFEWVFNSYYGQNIIINYIEHDDKIKGDWDEHKFFIENKMFRFYSDVSNHRIFYININNDFYKDTIKLHSKLDNREELIITRYTDNIYVSELKNGIYYDENDFVVEINKDKIERYWIEKIN